MAAGRSEMVSNDCTMDGELTIRLYYACRYYNRLPALPTIRYALFDILKPAICLALLYLSILQPTIRSALPVDITTEYLICSTCRYYYRLFALPTFRYTRLSATLCLSILQPTLRSALSGD
jgi:hypothetical protein